MTDNLEKNSLLIVNSNEESLTVLMGILQPGYTVHAAKDSVSALYMADKAMPDLILLDTDMPQKSGHDVLADLKKNDATKHIPVIFIAQQSDTAHEDKGSADVVDYIYKPLDAEAIKTRVAQQIKIINLQRDLETALKNADMANRTKSDFLSKLRYEVRKPLSEVLGILDFNLQSEILPSSAKDDFNKLFASGKLLLESINELLDISKIESGKMEIVSTQYELASLINDSIQSNIFRIEDKPVKFDLQIEDTLPARLVGDNNCIARIISPLLSNAFKYTSEGLVILSFDTITEPNDNEVTLVIRVRDTGCGISDEQLKILFDQPSYFEDRNNHSFEGIGLGLMIVKHLVALMNGEITVESEPGVGSLFIIKLPQVKTGDDVMGRELAENLRKFHMNFDAYKAHQKIARNLMPYGSVLIVDDMEPNLYVAMRLMKLYRLRIETVMSGYAAIEKIKAGRVYDAIFIDHMMPEMDGIETAKQLRGMGYEHPLIALTADVVAGKGSVYLQNGFDNYISKPIDIYQLDAILNEYIRDRKVQKLIFIVDNNDDNLIKAASVLETEYQVMTMLSVEKMFMLLKKKLPDIILLHKDMLDIYGFDVIEKLKKRSLWKDIPIVFLEKPFEPSVLPEIVMKNISK